MHEKRTTFASKLGIILAAAGSAVGLGNIWRFPSETAGGGGAVFILVFVGCVLFFGIPVMIAEFIIGRASRANTAGAYKKLAPKTRWKFVGYLGILTGFVIMGFYFVVCGWTLDFFMQSIIGELQTVTDYSGNFNRLLQNPIRQVFWLILFVAITAYFIISGVKKGIERSSKIFMPILFVLLIILAIRSMTLESASEGLAFLFKPTIEKIKPTVFLDAMGQAFFSLSLGMGCMSTYASYFRNDSNLAKSSMQVAFLDVMVAILAGMVIFPAAFALSANNDSIVSELVAGGPGLLFITLPNLFNQMPLSMVWSSMFFLLLALAALTSTISLLEVVTLFLHEEHKISRKRSTLYVAIGSIALGIVSSFSPHFFGFLDFASAKVLLPLAGFFISLFVGWHLEKSLIIAQLTNNDKLKYSKTFIKVYIFILRYIAPVAILAIFLYGLTS